MVRIKNLPIPTVKAIKFEKIFLSFLPCRRHKRIPGRQTTAPLNCFFPFIVSFLSFQLNVSFPFLASFLSFRLFLSMRYFCPFVPCLIFRSLLLPIRFNSIFVSFQLFVSVHCVFPFVSPFPYYALLPSARFKSYILFVSSSLSFQFFPAVCSVLPSDLILPVSSQLFLSVRCVLSFISSLLFHLNTSFLSY